MAGVDEIHAGDRSLNDPSVAIARVGHGYATAAPYHPHARWPEYPFDETSLSAEPNPGYEGVRQALRLLELDAERFGAPEWNPLGGIVRPGDTVVLKPNFVREFRDSDPDHANCVVTHGSVIRAVSDYVHIALGGRGRIIIADASHNDADFDAISVIAGLERMRSFYRDAAGFDLEYYDLRPERAHKIDGVIVGHSPLSGDPEGYVKVDLGDGSAFAEVQHLCHLIYGSEYDRREIVSHHTDGRHEYLISGTVLKADVVVSIPKLKTHKKVGITVNMKNMVGINGNKNWLPHHREGTPDAGGDQFPHGGVKQKLERSAVAGFKRLFPLLGPLRRLIAAPVKGLGKRVFGETNVDTIRSGNWHGNDTTWRTCIDLNRILLYADAQGTLQPKPTRRFFSIVDGIVAGEGNGPLDPTPKEVGVVIAGSNPVAVDLACARIMGFDWEKLPMLSRALASHPLSLGGFGPDSVRGRSNDARCQGSLADVRPPAGIFRPSMGWMGHVESVDGPTRQEVSIVPER